MENLNKIAEILKDPKGLIKVANECSEAYAVGISHPEYHEPFGEENPEMVAQNMAGIQAVNSGIGILAAMRGVENADQVDDMVIVILTDIANENLTNVEKSVMLRLANCTWGAGQAFRTDKGHLGRLTGMNVFDLLDSVEVEKDMHQINAAANWLLQKLSA
ncbi:MAG: hypothetical protein KAI72_07000 [Candidatus Pacebacteria bacterium]|nr:hypothetical protein [Candidatus Paceibacterota bacterium]